MFKRGHLGGPKSNLTGVLIRRGNSETEERPYDDIVRRQPLASQGSR